MYYLKILKKQTYLTGNERLLLNASTLYGLFNFTSNNTESPHSATDNPKHSITKSAYRGYKNANNVMSTENTNTRYIALFPSHAIPFQALFF